MSKPASATAQVLDLCISHLPSTITARSPQSGYTALHLAFSLHRPSQIKVLLESGADVTSRDKNGRNVLHFAVKANRNKHDHTLKLILDNECFSNLINAKDGRGNTPLHHLAHLANSNYPLALDLLFHPKLNARVFNKKNLSPLEVIDPSSPEYTISTVSTILICFIMV